MYFSALKTPFSLGTLTLMPVKKNDDPGAGTRIHFCHRFKSVLFISSVLLRKKGLKTR